MVLPLQLTPLACRCIQGVGIGFLGNLCQCAEILPESPTFGSLSPAGSMVASTTRRAAPWGIESGEARGEDEPELYPGVHAEMIGQTAGRKMSADLHLWSQPEAEDQPDCCICPVLVFWSISFREDYEERCREQSQTHDHLRQWPKLQTLGRAERSILDYEVDGFTNCNQNEQNQT